MRGARAPAHTAAAATTKTSFLIRGLLRAEVCHFRSKGGGERRRLFNTEQRRTRRHTEIEGRVPGSLRRAGLRPAAGRGALPPLPTPPKRHPLHQPHPPSSAPRPHHPPKTP